MKRNTSKSSITLPPKEIERVLSLKARLGASSNVEVIRRGLALLEEVTERERLRDAYRRASHATRASLSYDIDELDSLVAEGLDDE